MPEKYARRTGPKSNSTWHNWATSKTFDVTDPRVRVTPTVTAGQWNDWVDGAPDATPFHRYGCLDVAAAHADATLYPFAAMVNDRPVMLCPTFASGTGPVTRLSSPPRGLGIPALGPLVLDVAEGHDRERGAARRRALDALLSCFHDTFGMFAARVVTGPQFDDPRPFAWRGFDVTPRHTYVATLPDDAAAIGTDSDRPADGSARGDGACRIVETDATDLPADVAAVIDRLSPDRDAHTVSPALVRDLAATLPTGTVRTYVAREDGGVAGILVALDAGRTIHRWLAWLGPQAADRVATRLDRRVARDAVERGLSRYDLGGADDPAAGTDAPFDPDLALGYEARRRSVPTRLVAAVGDRVG